MSEKKVYKAEEKLKIVLEGMSGTISVADLCRKYNIGTTRFYYWKDQLMNSAPGIFESRGRKALTLYPEHEIERTGQVVPRSGGVMYYRGWEGTLFGKPGTIVVTLDPARLTEERGSRDILIREAASTRDRKRLSELKEDLGRIATATRGREGMEA